MKKNNFLKKGVILLLTAGNLLFISCATTKGKVVTAEQQQALEVAKKEKEIGSAAFAKLAGKYGVLRDEDATAFLNKFGKSLALYCERQEFEYFFAILNSENINAYSLPGGYILITKGALKALQTPGELAGIICHELGHVNKRHITNNIKIETKMNFFEILARFIAGPRQVVSTMAAQVSEKIEEKLFIDGFDADTEFEADVYAAQLLAALNINLDDYIAYLQRLGERTQDQAMQELDKTHPAVSERLSRLNNYRVQEIRALSATENFQNFMNQLQEE